MFVEIEVIAPPVLEPVTIQELKTHARIVDPPDAAEKVKLDGLLTQQIVAARGRCEGYTRRAIITQTVDIWYHSWDGPGVIEHLPRPPHQAITEIVVYDQAGNPTTVDSMIYTMAGRSIIFSDWIPEFRPYMGIRVQSRVGYGDDPEDVPADLKIGILEYATMLYEHRMGEPYEAEYAGSAAATEQMGAIPPSVYDLWRPFQVIMI